MIKKLIQGIIVSSIIVIVPTIGNLEILNAPHLWILILIGILASLFQPQYNPFKHAPEEIDKGTANQIIWTIYITQLFMLIEAIYFRYPECISWNTFTIIGLIMMVFGLILRSWAVFTLGKFFTWHIAVQDGQSVVRTGPYKLIRHPGYSGAFLTYVGTSLFLGAWIAFALSFIFLLFAFTRRVHFEEKELKKELGVSYENYCKEVKRFIPWIF